MEILFRGICRFFCFFYFYSFFNVLFGRFFSFPSLYENQKKCKVSVYPSFYFITLAKVFFHLLASLRFSYTPKLGTCIGMLLDRNVIKLNIFFCRKIVLQSNHSAFHGMFVHLIHAVCSPLSLYIVLKFTFYSWQVPRSSVGRALYRESGLSQDGDPDTGNLPFFLFDFFFYLFFLCFVFFLQMICSISHFLL